MARIIRSMKALSVTFLAIFLILMVLAGGWVGMAHAEELDQLALVVGQMGGAPGSGSADPISFVGVRTNYVEASSDTIATSSTIDIQVGDLVVIWAYQESNKAATCSAQDDASTPNVATGWMKTSDPANTWMVGQAGYYIATTAKTGATITATWSVAVTYKRLIVHVLRKDASHTWTLADYAVAGQSAQTAVTPAVSANSSNSVAVVGICNNDGYTASNLQIAGSAATEQPSGGFQSATGFYTIFDSAQTDITGSAYYASGSTEVAMGIFFFYAE